MANDNETMVFEQEFAKIPQNMGDYDELVAQGVNSFGIKERVFRYGCEWESKVENNTYAPATLNESTGVITPDTTHWRHVSGSYEMWLVDHGYGKLSAANVKDVNQGNKSQQTINTEVGQKVAALENAVGTGGTVDQKIAAEAYRAKNVESYLGGKVTTLETAVGSGGSVDSRIAAAKAEIKGNATSDCDTLGEAEAKINANTSAISTESLRAQTAEQSITTTVTSRLDTQDAEIALLNGAEVIVVEDHTQVSSPDPQKIYREIGTSSYTDWMNQGSGWKAIATYNPGIDEKPARLSDNLVKSGGVARSLEKVSEIDKEKIYNKDESIIIASNSNETIVSISEEEVDCKNLKSNGTSVLAYTDLKTKNLEQEIVDSYDDSVEVATNDGAVVVRIDKSGIDCKDLKINGKSINSGGSQNTDATYLRNYIKDSYIVENKSLYFNLPEYPTSFEDDGYLDNKIKNIPEGKHFIFITDTHWDTSSRNTTYLANYVKKRIGIDKVVFGGDVLNEYHANNGSSYASHKSAQEIAVFSEEFFSQFGKDAIWCEGNHDGNCIGLRIVLDNGSDTADNYNKYLVPDSVLFDKTIRYVDGAHFDEEALAAVDDVGYTAEQLANVKAFLKMCYYVDDEINKIRFIVIDTGVGAVAENIYMGFVYAESNKLFFKTLIKFLSSTPEEYDVVVCGHMIVWDSITHDFSPVISAFKVGASTVKLDDWTWKSFNGAPVYMSPIDFQIKETSPSVGDKAFVLDLNTLYGKLFNVYVCETTGVWRKTNELFAKSYATLSDLEELWPNPKAGYFAYVGGYVNNTYNFEKYICRTNGIWEDSGESIISSNNPIVYGSNSVLVNAVSPELAGGGFFNLNFNSNTKFNHRIFTVSGHWHMSGAFISQPNTNIAEGGIVDNRAYTNLVDYESPVLRTNGAILNVVVEDACLKNDGVPFPDTSSEVHRKTINTLNEQAFDVVTITDDNKVVCTRFGAGTDRIFNL